MSDFSIKKGATAPSIVLQLRRNGQAINLSTAGTVTLRATHVHNPNVTLERTMSVNTASTGHVSYGFDTPGDTSTPGDYLVDVVIDWNSTESEVVPNGGYATLRIV